MMLRIVFCGVLIGLIGMSYAEAAVIAVGIGGDSPPAALGPYAMFPFDPDPRPDGELVDDVPSPIGGEVLLSDTLTHLISSVSWATCSGHAVGGEDVYFADDLTSVTLTLPPDTGAFYIYAGPNGFDTVDIEAECGGTPLAQTVDPFVGAAGFGFYTDDGTELPPITFTTTQEFMVGCHIGIARAAEGACDSGAACPDTDVNCDDITDGFDIAVVRQSTNWLMSAVDAEEPRADVNDDGIVDGFDIAEIRGGRCWLR